MSIPVRVIAGLVILVGIVVGVLGWIRAWRAKAFEGVDPADERNAERNRLLAVLAVAAILIGAGVALGVNYVPSSQEGSQTTAATSSTMTTAVLSTTARSLLSAPAGSVEVWQGAEASLLRGEVVIYLWSVDESGPAGGSVAGRASSGGKFITFSASVGDLIRVGGAVGQSSVVPVNGDVVYGIELLQVVEGHALFRAESASLAMLEGTTVSLFADDLRITVTGSGYRDQEAFVTGSVLAGGVTQSFDLPVSQRIGIAGDDWEYDIQYVSLSGRLNQIVGFEVDAAPVP